ncbi:MAG: HAMP domain-containing histidine kinase [Ruminococcus flavefaciens]|nr:HAMP domain-containing histidine kinase [Ruminococcus flavefaciens]
MKTFNRIFAVVLMLIAVIFAGANLILINKNSDNSRLYRVEIERMAVLIENGSFSSADLSECVYITEIAEYSDSPENFYKFGSDYVVREINGELYRFDYNILSFDKNIITYINIILAVMSAVIIGVMLYIRAKILAPFEKLVNVPYELSKGNLTAPVKAEKNRFFGKFIWGIDLLRENMEEQKKRELEFQKEKKTLLLSLSHDIKTPLSAIKLYSMALSKGLYSEKKKQVEIAKNINGKADEIEDYISQIIKASNEDFLHLEVENGEFYLSELISRISDYYSEKLKLIHTDFSIDSYSNCIIKGDIERSIEVLQNIIENAIKYGDGKSIEVLFREEDGCQLITVKNSGNTLPSNEIIHIFESFHRGTNAKDKSGSGLGLYICRQLMRKMNGDIFAETENDFMNVTCVFQKA